jgi:Tfp pilus tip-associated adhesin PilY1
MKAFNPESTLTLRKAFEEAIKSNVVLYSQIDKFRKQRVHEKSKEYTYFKDTKNMIRQYEIEMGTWKSPTERSKIQVNWYYRDLKDKIYFGSTEEIAKAYYDAFDYVYQESYKSDTGLMPKARAKKAHADVMSSVNSMNPLDLSNELKGRYYSKREHALNWIKKQPGGFKAHSKAVKAHNIFQKNYNFVEQIKNNRKFMQKYSGISELYMY